MIGRYKQIRKAFLRMLGAEVGSMSKCWLNEEEREQCSRKRKSTCKGYDYTELKISQRGYRNRTQLGDQARQKLTGTDRRVEEGQDPLTFPKKPSAFSL